MRPLRKSAARRQRRPTGNRDHLRRTWVSRRPGRRGCLRSKQRTWPRRSLSTRGAGIARETQVVYFRALPSAVRATRATVSECVPSLQIGPESPAAFATDTCHDDTGRVVSEACAPSAECQATSPSQRTAASRAVGRLPSRLSPPSYFICGRRTTHTVHMTAAGP
ncbi:hypothetical protein V5799_021058 [Amblyomma americanum]|uniref:Uncharacterized protein n=1 Tax=Amblyomma americanum TaxID=6943 RepID=A0AAQ4FTX4_AMBAM